LPKLCPDFAASNAWHCRQKTRGNARLAPLALPPLFFALGMQYMFSSAFSFAILCCPKKKNKKQIKMDKHFFFNIPVFAPLFEYSRYYSLF
jgi:hypothetical protein